jgi:methylthioribose-1-phosphate isomerase
MIIMDLNPVDKLTIYWDDGIIMVDQTMLPARYEHIKITTIEDLRSAIVKLKVRGAPALGAAGAFGVALAAYKSDANDLDTLKLEVRQAAKLIIATRSTAINLFTGVDKILKAIEPCATLDEVKEIAVEEAKKIADEDIIKNKALSAVGASILKDGDVVMTYCNAGRLATVGWGTALGVIKSATLSGKRITVYVCETRPLNQGSRITAFEMLEEGIPTTLIADNMAAWIMKEDKVDCIIVGADRITRQAVYNKVGTYMLAICAKHHGIPFYVAAPLSTCDFHDRGVEIEQRDSNELIYCGEKQLAPKNVKVKNPAFDATPLELVTKIITENGIRDPLELMRR